MVQKQRVCKTTVPNSSAQLWQVHFYVKAHVNNNSLIPCDTSLIRLAHIHGQWTCDENFFSKISQIIGQFGVYLGYFHLNHQHTFCHCVSLVHDLRFSINQPSFLQKNKILKHIKEKIYLGLGYEFGMQRVRGLAIMRP